MVFRVYVEKREGLRQEAGRLFQELRDLLQIPSLRGLRLLSRYDVEGLSAADFDAAVQAVLSEPQADCVYRDLPIYLRLEDGSPVSEAFAVEYLPGQYDQRADSAEQCIQFLLAGERPRVRSAKVYLLYGELSGQDLDAIKGYLINPVEAREAALAPVSSLELAYDEPGDVEILTGFRDLDEPGLDTFLSARGLAMDLPDLRFCQRHFREEGRDPSLTEIRVIDSYWSDHCRHTTFLTRIDDVRFPEGEGELREAWARYLSEKAAHESQAGKTSPACLMDLATLAAKRLREQGKLQNLDLSEEINACTVKIRAEIDGQEEDWLLLFKNETHNHPTEIEPFGGAATCIGGAIRDPLSGRAYVYQAMRVTGAADPTLPVSATMPGKLPQRKIVTGAAEGYSSYGNQIGLATGLVEEIYHPGYAAKRMEIGAVVAAAPSRNVRREKPLPGDVVLLLGGRTGRDGIGGATGSSKAHKLSSLESCGAEVQKGNAPEERKLQRLFRNPEAARRIKRCNDFGAGGVSVAIGELAEGLRIDLDKVPKKYEGLDGTELAISESQERMAVVLSREDMEAFCALAAQENLEATHVADVTEEPRLQMYWRGKKILDLPRAFLDSNGAEKHIRIEAGQGQSIRTALQGVARQDPCVDIRGDFAGNYRALAQDLNVCSQQGLTERFDGSIGAGTVLMPLGGRFQKTPVQAMAARIPAGSGHSELCSLMAYGYNPYISERNPYRGAYLAVAESVCKLIAAGAGAQEIYLSFQEYFGKPGQDPARWGQPLAALLGAFSAQLDLGIAAIGGKDSMSGSFEALDVPPTLVSFAITTDLQQRILSPEYKAAGNRVLWLRPRYENELPAAASLQAMFACIRDLARAGRLASAYTPCFGGIAAAVLKQCLGNGFGFRFAPSLSLEDIFSYQYGAFLLELWEAGTADGLYADARLREAGVDVIDLGTVEQGQAISYNADALPLSELEALYEARLSGVYPCRPEADADTDANAGFGADAGTGVCPAKPDSDAASLAAPEVMDIEGNAGIGENLGGDLGRELDIPLYRADAWFAPREAAAKPKVLIPVFPGTNCEYDSARACREAGLSPEVLVLKNLRKEDIEESVARFARTMQDAQILFLPGGFSGGDEPDGSAKFITSFFRNARVREATMALLEERDGLVLGICNGFQALIKLGLVPYGEIRDMDAHSPTLSYNAIGRHQSRIVRCRVSSNLSPWLMNTEAGGVYNVAVSHGEGRFLCKEHLFQELAAKGQVALQYVDLEGKPSMDIAHNPNGSFYAVEGISSPDGRVLGRMGHVERYAPGNFKNVPGNYDMGLFRSAREYYA